MITSPILDEYTIAPATLLCCESITIFTGILSEVFNIFLTDFSLAISIELVIKTPEQPNPWDHAHQALDIFPPALSPASAVYSLHCPS
jgi:hypothetical protein